MGSLHSVVAARCVKENVDHQGFLLQLAELELLDREKRASQRCLKAAKFPNIKTLDAFDLAAQPSLKVLVTELTRCQYIDDLEPVILVGNSGTGKSRRASALDRQACRLGYRLKSSMKDKQGNQQTKPRTTTKPD